MKVDAERPVKRKRNRTRTKQHLIWLKPIIPYNSSDLIKQNLIKI